MFLIDRENNEAISFSNKTFQELQFKLKKKASSEVDM